MNDLSAEARDILESGRAAMAPADSVRHRVREAVAARAAAGPGVATAAGGSALKLVILSGLVIGSVVVGAVMLARRSDGATKAPARAVAPVSAADPMAPAAPVESPQTAAPTVRELAPETPAAPAPAQPRRKAAARAGLGAELALLEEARTALRAGAPGQAMAALDRHGRIIEEPQLEREALLLRAEALCGVGDRDAGLRTLDEVARRWPRAGGVEAVRARCER